MQHIHAFNISPKEYYIRGKKNDFPQVDVCPCCSYPAILPSCHPAKTRLLLAQCPFSQG
jgi:hypothetical protein